MLDTRNNFNFWLWPAQALLLAFAISLSSVVIADETETQASVSTEHKALVSQLLNGFHEAAANARFDDYFGRFSAEGVDLHLKLTQDLHLKLTHPGRQIMA